MSGATRSNDSQGPHAGPSRRADNDVIADGDFEKAAGFGYAAGDLDIGLAWRAVVRRMVVRHDQARRAEFQSPQDDLSRINRNGRNSAAGNAFLGNEAAFRIEKQYEEILGRQKTQPGTQIVRQLFRRREDRAGMRPGAQRPEGRLVDKGNIRNDGRVEVPRAKAKLVAV